MAREGLQRDVAGKQHRADDQADRGRERERANQQPLVQRDGDADHGGGVKQQHLAGAVEAGPGRRVRAGGEQDHAGGAHQSGQRDQDRRAHACLPASSE